MKILLTGGTGYIGSAVLDRLTAAGHEVTAVVRSDESRAKVEQTGATGLVGDLFDSVWLREQLVQHDAGIHTAAGSDADDEALNTSVVDAAIAVFGGTTNPFVLTGGVWTYGSGADLSEDAAANPVPLTAWRVPLEQRLLDSGVRASVVQPGIVYGHGTGIPAMLVSQKAYPGTGDQHWTTVHVDDLADLYVSALESPGGQAYLGVNGENPTVREIGEAIGSDVVAQGDAATLDALGPFGEALLLDQQASGAKARTDLGWSPSRPSLVELLREGYPSDR